MGGHDDCSLPLRLVYVKSSWSLQLCRSVQSRYISTSQIADLQPWLLPCGQPAPQEQGARAASVSDEHTSACRRCQQMLLLWSCTADTNFGRDQILGFPQSDLVKGQAFSCGERTRSVTACSYAVGRSLREGLGMH